MAGSSMRRRLGRLYGNSGCHRGFLGRRIRLLLGELSREILQGLHHLLVFPGVLHFSCCAADEGIGKALCRKIDGSSLVIHQRRQDIAHPAFFDGTLDIRQLSLLFSGLALIKTLARTLHRVLHRIVVVTDPRVLVFLLLLRDDAELLSSPCQRCFCKFRRVNEQSLSSKACGLSNCPTKIGEGFSGSTRFLRRRRTGLTPVVELLLCFLLRRGLFRSTGDILRVDIARQRLRLRGSRTVV